MASPEECSQEVLATVPLLMWTIGREVRRERKPELSVPQFRALAFLYREPGASLSQVAEHLGLMLPSMSRIADGLVERGLVARETCVEDRRRLGLTLTAAGKALFRAARRAAQARLAEILGPLSAGERVVVVSAMRTLRRAFAVREGAGGEVTA